MANNRMFLVYEPSGLGIMLGKRMAWGWYLGPKPLSEDRMNRFFDKALEESDPHRDQDAFIIVRETDEGWDYGPDDDPDFWRFVRVKAE